MTAVHILVHAWRMITHDPAATLRVVLVPMLVSGLPILVFNFIHYGYFYGEIASLASNDSEQASLSGYLFAWVCMILGWVWLAISWHRYALTGASNGGWLPTVPVATMVNYLGKGFLLTIPIILILIVTLLCLIAVEDLDDPSTFVPGALPSAPVFLIFCMAFVAMTYIILRAGPALVLIALGKSGSLRLAWRKSTLFTAELWGLAAILGGIQGSAFIAEEYLAFQNTAYLAYEVLRNVIALLQLSVITTLYGVIYEGRDLEDAR